MSLSKYDTDLDEKALKNFGVFAFFLLTLGLILFAVFTRINIPQIYNDFVSVYFGGNFNQIALTLGGSIKLILQYTLLDLAISLLILQFIPKGKSISMGNIFGNGPIPIYITIIAEELFARWFFITVIGTWIFQGSYLAIIISLVVGNVVWALVHLSNYKDPADRKIMAVLPQLLSGFIYAFIYIRYGFIVCLFVHLTFDFVLMAMDKKRNTVSKNIINGIYWLVVLLATLFVVNWQAITLPSLTPWLNNELVAPATQMWPMVALILYSMCFGGLLTNLLGFDDFEDSAAETLIKNGFLSYILNNMLAMIILIGLIAFLSWGLSLFIHSAITVAIIICLLFVLISQPKSGSAMANVWFVDMPITFLQVFVILTFPFWTAFWILVIASIAKFFPLYITARVSD